MMYNYKQLNPEACEFVAVSSVDEIPDGVRFFVDIDDRAIVVFNIAGGFFAIDNVCTHDSGPLGEGAIDGHEVVCPRHGGRFDIRTGKATSFPAFVDIMAYPVKIVDGMVELGIPAES